MRKLFVFFIFLLCITAILAIEVSVEVRGVIRGRKAYLEFNETSINIQRIMMDWENIGSVGCKVRMRIDVFNSTDQLYTGWSPEEPLEAGDHTLLTTYWIPSNPGNYSANITVYHCNRMFFVDTINFSMIMRNFTEMPARVRVNSDEHNIIFEVKAMENIDDIVLIPSNYPLGWVLESKKISGIKKGETKRIKLGYEAEIWKPRQVTFDMVTEDGRYKVTKTFTLKKGKNYGEIVFLALSLLFILSLTINIYLLKGKLIIKGKGANFAKSHRCGFW